LLINGGGSWLAGGGFCTRKPKNQSAILPIINILRLFISADANFITTALSLSTASFFLIKSVQPTLSRRLFAPTHIFCPFYLRQKLLSSFADSKKSHLFTCFWDFRTSHRN